MTIHILDINDLSVIGLVHDYESFSMTLNYSKIGDFVLSLDNRMESAKMLVKNRIVMLDRDGFQTGVITNISIDIDEDGYETRIIKGKTLGHLLNHRVITDGGTSEYSFASGSAETVMKHYVEQNAVESADTRRNYEMLMIAQDKQSGSEVRWQSKMDVLSDVIEEIAEYQKMGWSIYIDLSRNVMVFDTYEGKDLKNEVIFSTQYGNLSSQSYTYDEYTERNFAYVAGEIFDRSVELDPETGQVIVATETIINATTGQVMTVEKVEERRIYEVGSADAQGVNRKETFIEVSESQEEYIDVPELGKRRLQEMSDIEAIEVKVLDNSLFTYGEDYGLGDIVTVHNEDWGITRDLRVNSVTIEIDKESESKIFLTFGTIMPKFKDRMNHELKALKPYTKR